MGVHSPPVEGVAHWAAKDGVRLFLWEKFVDSPSGKPVVLFVHGSSMASQPTFDLTVPERPDSSVMDWFAKRGFTCWCVDMEGYGRSDKDRDITCDIANGAADLEAATDYMRMFAEQIRPLVGRRYVVLGTDGFGRSDTREKLRTFFEVNPEYVVVATLKALADEGTIPAARVAEAIAKYKLDPDKPAPWTV